MEKEKKTPHRMGYFALAFFMLLSFGVIYAWTLFVEPLESEFGWERVQTSGIFTLSCITVCLGMILSGILEKRYAPRVSFFLTAALVGVGLIASSFTTSIAHIYVFYGILVGTGVGVGTNCALSTALKWFPDKQGVASGGLLMGYGGGATILSPIVTTLLEAMGWRSTFWTLGVAFAALIVAGAFFLRAPGPDDKLVSRIEGVDAAVADASVNFTSGQMMRTPSFWMAFCWLILGTSGGLALVSQAAPATLEVLGPDAPTATTQVMAALATGLISAFNGFGRLFNGIIWDHKGYRASLVWVSLSFVVAMLLCAVAIRSGSVPLLMVGLVFTGLMFGANMSATAALTSTFYGQRNFGINYGIMVCQMIPAALIGPQVLALTQMGSGSYEMAFWVFFAIAVVGFALSFFIKRPKVKVGSEEGKEDTRPLLDGVSQAVAR